eukprot:3912723-Prymnesium_polylepis.1
MDFSKASSKRQRCDTPSSQPYRRKPLESLDFQGSDLRPSREQPGTACCTTSPISRHRSRRRERTVETDDSNSESVDATGSVGRHLAEPNQD